MRLLPLLGWLPVAAVMLAARWWEGRREPLRPEVRQPSNVRVLPPPIDMERETAEALAVGDGRALGRRVQRARLRIVGGERP